MSASNRHVYRTDVAMDGTLSRGFDLSYADWRDAFLAIMDVISGETLSSRTNVMATYIGPVRDGCDRWTISFSNRPIDLIYDPHRAMFTRAVDTAKR